MQQRDATAIDGGIIMQEPIMPYTGITLNPPMRIM